MIDVIVRAVAGPKRPANAAPPSSRDIDAACRSLQDLKRHLHEIGRIGGGEPSSGLLSAAADDCLEAVFVCTDVAEIRMVNGAAARLTGYSTRELQASTWWDLTHSSSQSDFDVLWREFLRAGRQRGLYTLRYRDGSPLQVAYCSEAGVFRELCVTVVRKAQG